MITDLSVQDLAIIQRTEVQFERGFTALTGETGAGKSLLVDALELALGERADSELVRAEADRASVALTLDLSNHHELALALEALDVELEEGRLFLQRTVSKDGRSNARINGRSAPVGTLKSVGKTIVDLHGQHNHQSLIDPASHLGYLDAWIGAEADKLRERAATAVATADRIRTERRRLERGVAEREHRIDLLTFQIGEIEEAAPTVGEQAQIEADLLRRKNSEALIEAVNIALGATADGENAALDGLRIASKTLDGALKFDEGLTAPAEEVRQALYEVQDAVETLRGYLDSLEYNPAELDAMQDRVDVLKRLRKKYGAGEEEVLAYAEGARRELAELKNAETAFARIDEDLAKAVSARDRECARLTALRTVKAPLFAKAVVEQLQELAMAKASLSVAIAPKEPDSDGADAVEFVFSANAGEPPRPLAKIASGGELSRVMLALKIALAGRAGVPVLIFDEVDTGLGGRAAATMGRKLRELGEHYQVLVISHLPQVAAQAHHQFRIEKGETDGRTTSRLVPLSGEERELEIARMLAGETITDAARASAREMLAQDAQTGPRA